MTNKRLTRKELKEELRKMEASIIDIANKMWSPKEDELPKEREHKTMALYNIARALHWLALYEAKKYKDEYAMRYFEHISQDMQNVILSAITKRQGEL